ncbi:MAG: guanylate kinase, partial [Ruminococcus sp.]|nr:guanylate kinase [Ruminococcus sp.]
VSREDFEERIGKDMFLEYAEYCGNYYGTLLSEVDPYLEKGIDVILEIEVQGAMKIRQKRPDAVFIFIAPPSVSELRRRLNKRGTETQEVIEERISQAAGEIALAEKYDYVIVNDALEDAVDDFFAVMRAEKLKAANSGDIINEVLK